MHAAKNSSSSNAATTNNKHFAGLVRQYQLSNPCEAMEDSQRSDSPAVSSARLLPVGRTTRSSVSTPKMQTRLNFGGIQSAQPSNQSQELEDPPVNNKRKRSTTSSEQHKSVAKYAHLAEVPDTIIPGLILVLVGNNPGVTTAEMGHPYAHPTNLFWRLLHASGCTPRLLAPEEHRVLPELYSMGQTNIVSRPTKDASELTKAEMVAGAGVLEKKFAEFRPDAVCIVGKGIWEAIWRWKYSKQLTKNEFKWGWQEERHNMGKVKGEFKGSRVFVATSTSGLAASLSRQEKEDIWRPLGDFVKQRRTERGEANQSGG